MNDRRDEFLMTMYGEMWENINRHILVVWQSVGVLAGAFAALIIAEQTTVSLDVSASIVALVGCWQMAHVLDASWWFNQLIVANIERQFLSVSDAQQVHPYFSKHRDPSMLDYLRIQFVFGSLATTAVLIYHFIERIAPGFSSPIESLEPARALPYVFAGISGALLVWFQRHQRKGYLKLRTASPGRVD